MTTTSTTSRRAPSRRTLKLGTSSGIAQAGELKDRLAKLFERKSAVTLDGSELERIDTAILQLLACFARDAKQRGITVKWKGPSESARASISLVGIEQALGIPEDAQK